jgi:TonB-linked SusC/RagA family outer membrane protein
MEVTKTDLARLQTDDIASFSIMKDATATALYGARGANGVILITTKQGKVGKAKLSFRVETRASTPTRNIEMADPITYMNLRNEAVLTRNPLGALPYSKDKIAKTAAGADPYLYPATDWRKELISNYAFNQRVNLNIQGGGDVASYYVAGSMSNDNGNLKVPKTSSFNNNISLRTSSLRANVNINVTKTTELITRVSGTFDDYTGPISGGTEVYKSIMHTNPVLFPAYYEPNEQQKYVKHILFGNFGEGKYNNPYADLVKGYKDYSRSTMMAQFELKQKLDMITKGLSFRGLINTTRNSYFDVTRQYTPFFYQAMGIDEITGQHNLVSLNENSGTEYLNYAPGKREVSSVAYLESALDYARTFNENHSVSGLLVYNMRDNLTGNATTLQESLAFRNVGISGRATYGYGKRYFAELNFGYNGTERFDKSHRFGFFPSAGLAWSISNEPFWTPVKNLITNMKLRASYGIVGNDAIGAPSDRFFYLSEMNMNDASRGSVFGVDGAYNKPGISIKRYSNPDITWEVSHKSNVALEMELFRDLSIIAEVYKENRENILMTRSSIPSTMGLSADIRANVGKANSQGTDISLDYNHSFNKNFWIQARGNFTYATSKFLVYEEPDYNEKYLTKIGQSLSQRFGYIADRLFIDDEEVRNSPLQNFGVTQGGDIKYHDTNGDGKITSLDQVPIGYPTTPEIIYGFGASFGYKGFDLSLFFQGSARSSFWIDPETTAPFQNETQLLKVYADNHWSEENRNIYALWPRLSQDISSNNTQVSTWFMQDGSFLRLKQLEVGYTLNSGLLKKIHMDKVRIYLTGSNLLLWSKFKLWDVEMAGNGLGYPIQHNFCAGLNVSF